MEIYKILQEIMDEKSLSIPEIARLCNLSDSTVRAIMVRKSKSVALEVAFKLSKGLNVSLERLNGEKEKSTATLDDGLDPVKNELIDKIGKLSSSNLAKLSELIDLFLTAQDKTE